MFQIVAEFVVVGFVAYAVLAFVFWVAKRPAKPAPESSEEEGNESKGEQ